MILWAVVLGVCVGCEERVQPTARPVEPVGPTFETLATLDAESPTVLAVDPAGGLWFTQQRSGRQGTVFYQANDGVPRRSGLSVETVRVALGVDELEGQFAGFIADDGGVVFAFVGGAGAEPVVVVGRHDVAARRTSISIDTDRLAELTGFGGTIALAEATLMADGDEAWLWLRTPDRMRGLTFSPAKLRDPLASVPVSVSMARVMLDFVELDLTRPGTRLTPGVGESLVLTHVETAAVYTLTPGERGVWEATLLLDLGGLPERMTPPASDGRGGLAAWLPVGRQRPADVDRPYRPPLTRGYPAVLVLQPGAEPTVWEADDFGDVLGRAAGELVFDALRPTGEPGNFVAYDEAGGDVIRLTLPE